jgi:hypothetical protein
MEQATYFELKKELEIYFSNAIKRSLKEYAEENFELNFCADYTSQRLINGILEKDGFEVYGMNVNMDGFRLLLDFKYEYNKIENFIFTRLAVDFNNDGNYSIYLNENSFDDEWNSYIEDEFLRYRNMSQVDFEKLLVNIKKTHLMLMIKG